MTAATGGSTNNPTSRFNSIPFFHFLNQLDSNKNRSLPIYGQRYSDSRQDPSLMVEGNFNCPELLVGRDSSDAMVGFCLHLLCKVE